MIECRLVGTNLIIPHIVGNSGVLRNFSAYFAQLIDVQDTTDLQVLPASCSMQHHRSACVGRQTCSARVTK